LPPKDPPKDRQAGDKQQDQVARPPSSLRERLREHWLLVTVMTCLLLIAAIGGLSYWFSVRDYESTETPLSPRGASRSRQR
jgi:membrane fusion protein (multidrug efflux system)